MKTSKVLYRLLITVTRRLDNGELMVSPSGVTRKWTYFTHQYDTHIGISTGHKDHLKYAGRPYPASSLYRYLERLENKLEYEKLRRLNGKLHYTLRSENIYE